VRARAAIAELGARFIRPGSLVLVHGHSRVVLALLRRAVAQVPSALLTECDLLARFQGLCGCWLACMTRQMMDNILNCNNLKRVLLQTPSHGTDASSCGSPAAKIP
jgi:hypothetical protein